MSMCRKCDVCSAHGEWDEFHYILSRKENSTGSQGKIDKTVEVCPECYEKVLATLVPVDASDDTTSEEESNG